MTLRSDRFQISVTCWFQFQSWRYSGKSCSTSNLQNISNGKPPESFLSPFLLTLMLTRYSCTCWCLSSTNCLGRDFPQWWQPAPSPECCLWQPGSQCWRVDEDRDRPRGGGQQVLSLSGSWSRASWEGGGERPCAQEPNYCPWAAKGKVNPLPGFVRRVVVLQK